MTSLGLKTQSVHKDLRNSTFGDNGGLKNT